MENYCPKLTDQEKHSDYLVHYFSIKVLTKQGGGGEVVELIQWTNLRFELRLKYDWYFKYRAALAQVKHPRCFVDVIWGHELAEGKQLEIAKENRRRGKLRNLTRCKNLLSEFEKGSNSLFPLDQDPLYVKAKEKIVRLEKEYEDFCKTF